MSSGAAGAAAALRGTFAALAITLNPRVLRAAGDGDDGQALRRVLRDAPPPIADVARWWSAQDRSAREELLRSIPRAIGNLDGVDWADRFAANARTVARERDAVEQALASDPSNAELRARRRGLKLWASERRVLPEPRTGGEHTVRGHDLLGYDPEEGAVIEYSGPLADDGRGPWPGLDGLLLFVPGSETAPETIRYETNRADALRRDARPRTLGAITWANASFPSSLGEAARGTPAKRWGARLAHFGADLATRFAGDLVVVAFSFGGSIVGSAQALGFAPDRVLHLASAGLGPGVAAPSDYPHGDGTAHYALIAPEDSSVGFSQGLEFREWGHGASPLTAPGVTRLESGYRVDGERSSGLVRGHMGVWEPGSGAARQILAVVAGRDAELYAEPVYRGSDPDTGVALLDSPLHEPDYRPRRIPVPVRTAPRG